MWRGRGARAAPGTGREYPRPVEAHLHDVEDRRADEQHRRWSETFSRQLLAELVELLARCAATDELEQPEIGATGVAGVALQDPAVRYHVTSDPEVAGGVEHGAIDDGLHRVVVPRVAPVAPGSTAPAPRSEHCVSAPPTKHRSSRQQAGRGRGRQPPDPIPPQRYTGGKMLGGMSKVLRISSDHVRCSRSNSMDSVAFDGSADSSPHSL